jgi:formylmethanofuran dehydrogenase subunit E
MSVKCQKSTSAIRQSYASYHFVKVNKLWGEFLKAKRERERERKASENKQGEEDATMAAHTTTPVMITPPRAGSANNAIICALCGEQFATGEAFDNHMWCIHREREKSDERAWSSTD